MAEDDSGRGKKAGKGAKALPPGPGERPTVRIAPVKPKVGEEPGNLERREEHFRRRRR